jgi:glycosyltransferase involved in cell wall biosynthesis
MRILFFTPFGGRSGSEMMLFYLLRNMDRKAHQVALFCREQGEALSMLPGDIPVHNLPPRMTRWEKVNERIRRRFSGTSLLEHTITRVHELFRPDIWYINTLLMPEVVSLSQKLNVPFVLHAHELPFVYGEIKRPDLQLMIDNAVLLIACSKSVQEAAQVLGAKKVGLQYECIDLLGINPDPARAVALRRSLGIRETDFVWGMSGLFEYRKGADIFVDLARSFAREDVHFVWIGSLPNRGFDYFLTRVIEEHRLLNVHLVGKQTNDYYNYLSCCDGFVLTSREDPFPLVMIEAAALGKPIVSFNSGGVKEFVVPGTGEVIDSWNTNDLAGAMTHSMSGTTTFDAQLSKERAEAFDISIQVKNWEALLERLDGQVR